MSKFGQELIASVNEAIAIAKGEAKPARIFTPEEIDVAAIRKRLGLSQQKFADRFGLSHAMVRDWEQKRRNPDQAARTLLTLIARDPENVQRLLSAA